MSKPAADGGTQLTPILVDCDTGIDDKNRDSPGVALDARPSHAEVGRLP
ncbi:MAG TPA: hypothetical protein VF349_00480 [Candidatus Limnocylindrales bacterium]